MLSSVVVNAWSTLTRVYSEFSTESSVHGIKYTTTAKTGVLSRFLWLIVMIMSVLAAVRLASLFYGRHESGSMSTIIISDVYPTWKLSLPAITLCHGNIAMRKQVASYSTSQRRIHMPRGLTRADFENSLRYLREAIHPTNHFNDELDKLQHVLSANKLSLLELAQNIGPNCSDLLLMCQIQGKTVPCDSLIDPVLTPYGICCAFNYGNPQEDWQGRSKRERLSGLTFGSNFVLSFLLRAFPSNERVASVIHGDGVKVIIHESYTYPSLTAREFVAASGYETIARLNGYRFTSSDQVLALSAHTRGCSLSSHLSPAYPYRADNCRVKCQQSVFQRLCECVPFFTSTSSHSSWTRHRLCNLTHVTCLVRVARQSYSLGGGKKYGDDCDCLPDCEDTTYRVSTATSPLSKIQYNPSEFYQKVSQHPNPTALHITFGSQSATLLRRELLLPNINLVSSLGGVFSLFLGCSFISLVEIFYFFCIHLLWKLRHGKTTT